MTIRFRAAGVVALLIVLAIAAAACSGGGATPTPSPTPVPTPTPAASQAAGSGIPFPSIGNSDTALEALLPDAVDGITLQKYSMKGSEFLGSGQTDPQTVAFLNALGVDPTQVSLAFGLGVDIANQSTLGVFAFKAPGAGADTLLNVFKTTTAQGSSGYSWSQATVGGKAVEASVEPSEPGLKIYLYPTNDVMFLVTGNAGPAADTLAALP